MKPIFDLEPNILPITDGTGFPVRRVWCVGRNYRAHAIEMGTDPDRELPFYFAKPSDSVLPAGSTIAYPPETEDFQHEIELVIAIGVGGADIPVEDAAKHVFGHAVGLDFTRRDLQLAARKAGRPWETGKAFDQCAACGPIVPGSEPLTDGAISLTVNGEARQSSDISLLIWSVAEVVSDLSRYVRLEPGDLIFTGTPEGVGPIGRGDTLHGEIAGLPDLDVTIG
ncbi:MAG: fumarylacetoacetate hydrolase family protein [Erythrobacter sp.]|uniref:fumarylacetoacetate hydrolase family protein n=1 Tax=Erythrobacter sp. TaxID=1042 RepID=UPI002602B51A|nr:fumarylacetoacetate hydrolase family protein [Erythrobacter sp.]MDJ0978160.1 fumarylacetoacetate hydrolase family protein [Erythrobacter sp.]